MADAPGRSLAAIEPWLAELWEARGSDLLLTVGSPPLLRIDGEMRPVLQGEPLGAGQLEAIVDAVLGDEYRAAFAEELEVDFAFSWQRQARLRGNAYRQRKTCALALRMIPFEVPSFDDLGVPRSVRGLTHLHEGLVIVTGPSGSGKSTTLAAMIEDINANRACHIVTIEDPIEYLHFNARSVLSQREVGQDTRSFERALRSALREDPDVVLVGEMRDLESIRATMTLAETGHLVLATLHTNDSVQAIDRIIDVFPAERRAQIQVQLSVALKGVVYQRLVNRVGPGLVAAFEVLLVNHAMRSLIRTGKTQQMRNEIAMHSQVGMQTLEMSLSQLVAQGVIDLPTARANSFYPEEINAENRPATPGPASALPARGSVEAILR